MKLKTKNISKKTAKAFVVGTHEGQIFASVPYTQEDFKNSILIVSVLVNLFIFILWVLTQLSNEYAYQIILAVT